MAAQQLVAVVHDLPPHGNSTRWCVARTAEHWAYINLMRLGYEAFLPLCTVRRRDPLRHRLTHNVEVPLFRSYLFVRHTPGESWRSIRSAPGIQTLITAGDRLQYVAEGAVEALQATEALRRDPTTPQSVYRPGMACRLNAGPLRNHEAVVVKIDGNSVVVSVLLFGEFRHIAVPLASLSARKD